MKNNKIFAVIPARGGSKGIPKKNIKLLGGVPLICHTITAAREVFSDDSIIVSTDNLEIVKVVESIGLRVPFIRPESLAKDTSSTYDVLIHVLNYLEGNGINPDILVLLQPTSPFRTSLHIKEALQLYTENLEMVVSVMETNSNPYYNLFEENEEGFLKKSKNSNFETRQECPKVYEYNGAIYVINVAALRRKRLFEFTKIKKYIMNEESSLDIDTEFDWVVAESQYKKLKFN